MTVPASVSAMAEAAMVVVLRMSLSLVAAAQRGFQEGDGPEGGSETLFR